MWTPSFSWWVRTVASVEPMVPNAGESIPLEKVRQHRSRIVKELTVPREYASLIHVAAALLDGLFEHSYEYV